LADIFISSSSEEPHLTKRLAEKLQAHGYSVWWDVTLKSGDGFGSIIQERLRESKAAIVI
jgi:TIR domain